MLSRSLVLKVASWSWMENLVRKSFLFRPLVKRFIAGDTLAEGLAASDELLSKGFYVSLDLLGENVKTEAEAIHAKETYVEMLHACAKDAHFKPYRLSGDELPLYEEVETLNISIKLTQCGFDQSDELTEKHYREVLEVAKGYKTFVRVDMEGSPYTERTVAIIEKVHPDFPNAGTVLQSYLMRTPDDLRRLNAIRTRIRLVKGAYFEPASIAYQNISKINEVYIEQAKQMLKESHYPAIASHNEGIVNAIKAYVEAEKIDKKSFEFQMIYGIRRDLQNQLLAEGYNVRIYVPFGNSWYPYFSRRLAERPANMWFIFKSLFKG